MKRQLPVDMIKIVCQGSKNRPHKPVGIARFHRLDGPWKEYNAQSIVYRDNPPPPAKIGDAEVYGSGDQPLTIRHLTEDDDDGDVVDAIELVNQPLRAVHDFKCRCRVSLTVKADDLPAKLDWFAGQGQREITIRVLSAAMARTRRQK